MVFIYSELEKNRKGEGRGHGKQLYDTSKSKNNSMLLAKRCWSFAPSKDGTHLSLGVISSNSPKFD